MPASGQKHPLGSMLALCLAMFFSFRGCGLEPVASFSEISWPLGGFDIQ